MKKLFVILLMIIFISGCSKQSVYHKIHKKFYNMPSYRAKTIVTVISNKTKNTYDISALYDSTTDKYRIDFDGMSVILGDGNAIIKRDKLVTSAPQQSENMLMLLNSFFESYYVGEASSNHKSIGNNTVLECDIINPPKYANRMKLWIDSSKIIPKKMEIYDNNKKIMIVEFTEFEILKTVDQNRFNY